MTPDQIRAWAKYESNVPRGWEGYNWSRCYSKREALVILIFGVIVVCEVWKWF